MSAEVFTQALILGGPTEATLNELVRVRAELGVDISEPELHQRMNGPAVQFLKLLLGGSLQQFIANGPMPRGVLAHFRRVDILDSARLRIRLGDSPQNMAIFRRLALHILKQAPSKMSFKQQRFRAGLGNSFSLELPTRS